MITVETDLGTIKVAKNVIGDIINDVIDSFDGKVILSNSKGKVYNQLPYKLSQKDVTDVIDVDLTDNGLNIELYVILKFGTSINLTTKKIIDDIRSSFMETIGMEINNMTVVVTGMMSKHIAPRHIEVKG